MNQFFAGSMATVFMGIAAFATERSLKRIPKLHALTNTTEQAMSIVSELDEACPQQLDMPNLPCWDVLKIYLNSRANRTWANERRVEDMHSDGMALLNRVAKDHKAVKRAAAACVFGRPFVRLVPDCQLPYPRKLLWTYADEQEALSMLTPFCSPPQQLFIATRV